MKAVVLLGGSKDNNNNNNNDAVRQQKQQQEQQHQFEHDAEEQMIQEVQQQYHHHVAEDMISGFLAGGIAVSLGFPLDVMKTRMQTSDHHNNTTTRTTASQLQQQRGRTGGGTTNVDKSLYKTGRGIIRKEGVLGLYKGLTSPLLTLSFSSSISFTSYGAFREYYMAEQGWHIGNYLAGLSCGPIIGMISTVENHIRTQMQLDNVQKQRFNGSIHCIQNIIKYHGVSTLFTGWGITTMKDCAYFSSYFFIYEGVKGTLLNHKKMDDIIDDDDDDDSMDGHDHHHQKQQQQHQFTPKTAIPLAGGAAGIGAWMIAYPFDCVRAGLQGQSLKRGQTPTGYQVFQSLLQSRGIRGLFMGVTPTLMRAAIVHSVRFSAYESFLWLFRIYGRNNSHHEYDVEEHEEKHKKEEISSSSSSNNNSNNRTTTSSSSSVFDVLTTGKNR